MRLGLGIRRRGIVSAAAMPNSEARLAAGNEAGNRQFDDRSPSTVRQWPRAPAHGSMSGRSPGGGRRELRHLGLRPVGGADTYRGIAYQHAQAVLSALDVMQSDVFAAIRVEGADDVIDIELLDADGRVVVGL